MHKVISLSFSVSSRLGNYLYFHDIVSVSSPTQILLHRHTLLPSKNLHMSDLFKNSLADLLLLLLPELPLLCNCSGTLLNFPVHAFPSFHRCLAVFPGYCQVISYYIQLFRLLLFSETSTYLSFSQVLEFIPCFMLHCPSSFFRVLPSTIPILF